MTTFQTFSLPRVSPNAGIPAAGDAAVDDLEHLGIRFVDIRQGGPDVPLEPGPVALGALLVVDRLPFGEDGLVVLVGVFQLADNRCLRSLAPGDVAAELLQVGHQASISVFPLSASISAEA